MTWDPEQYEAFAAQRERPGLDLLAQVPSTDPANVVDLGCGPGRLTLKVAERWPGAATAGIDTDRTMLAAAEARDTDRRVSWMVGDLATWTSAQRVDVVLMNASLQWVDDHPRVLTHLVGQLAAGGVLAFQVPENYQEPSHRALAATVDDGPWAARLGPLLREAPVLPPERYHRLLSATTDVEMWETTYWHALAGEDPVLEWMKGTALRPLLPELGSADRERFLGELAIRLREAYPAEAGTTMLPFRRLFVIAQRA